jgi:hypothetical protein
MTKFVQTILQIAFWKPHKISPVDDLKTVINNDICSALMACHQMTCSENSLAIRMQLIEEGL